MSHYDAARIEKPRFFGIRPTARGRGVREPYIIGYDTEGDASRPFLMQFSEPELSEEDTWTVEVPDEENGGIMVFMKYVIERIMPRHFARTHEVIIYGVNLTYEWTQLLHDIPEEIRDQPEININMPVVVSDDLTLDFKWTIYNDKRVFAMLEHPKSKLRVRILDAQMFYKTGLDNMAKMLGLGEKYGGEHEPCGQPGAWHESGHDRAKITRDLARDQEFLKYAKRDAYITRLIGQHIVELHREYDIRQTISAPHFASSVFKRAFLDGEIALPHSDLEQYGLWSYHGGKNGFYLPGPERLVRCWQYDITSAYPEAMRQLPDPVRSEWRHFTDYRPGRHAVCMVTLQYRRCKWRGMMAHDGTWPESGLVEEVCITSYELDAMVQMGECDIISCHGWEMVGPMGGSLVEFVDTFFAEKATAVGAAREKAKLLLNSLYGKFFQKVAYGTMGAYDMDTGEIITTNRDGAFDFRAGGLYHPPIASLITGFVRARIHRLEHKYDAVMTSTDGIFALNPPDPADLGKHLGGLTAEQGTLSIWRERLYVFGADDAWACGCWADEPCRDHKPKAAYHGFWGSLSQLLSVPLEHGEYGYSSRHMVTLKESLRRFSGRRHEPGAFIDIERVITI